MTLSLVTGPVGEPITTAEAKAHLRVDTLSAEDGLIDDDITAARQWAESFLGRALLAQTWDLKLDDFPASDQAPIWLPLPPLQSVTSIIYTDTNGNSQTWAASNYIVDAPSGDLAEPGRIATAYQESYPTTRNIINAVTIRFVAGYGAASDVPQKIKQAMYLTIGHLYGNREAVVPGMTVVAVLPMGAEALLWPYRAMRFQR